MVAADKDAAAKAAVVGKVAAASQAEAAEVVVADSKVVKDLEVEVLGAAAALVAVLEWVEAWGAEVWVVAALAVHGEAVRRSTDVRCHSANQSQPRDATELTGAALCVALRRVKGWS